MELSKSTWVIAVIAIICALGVIATSQRASQKSHPELRNLEPINILAATNIDQCRLAIKGLNKLGGFNEKYLQSWVVEQPGRVNGLPIILNVKSNAIQFAAVLIGVDCFDGKQINHVSEIQTQTANMNIEATKKMGLQLCTVLDITPTAFLTWCDGVGNRSLDTPLFGSSEFRDVKDNKRIFFQTLHSFDLNEPWFIQVTVEDL